MISSGAEARTIRFDCVAQARFADRVPSGIDCLDDGSVDVYTDHIEAAAGDSRSHAGAELA
jgi:hypothetical protein